MKAHARRLPLVFDSFWRLTPALFETCETGRACSHRPAIDKAAELVRTSRSPTYVRALSRRRSVAIQAISRQVLSFARGSLAKRYRICHAKKVAAVTHEAAPRIAIPMPMTN